MLAIVYNSIVVARTYAGDHDYMTILPLSHDGKNSFDNVDICEEVGFERVLDKANSSIALG